ncbi:helicase C-terminal domain-containing protein [Micromonospora sp. DT81.3]|uniref:helicase C-terminal domain-containing protein n=1 Tax=Micromonospora sp. DT81.3 TaxID=3416523 RepID=UPI003CECB88E
MPFSFGELGSSGAISGIVEPGPLFDALPNKAKGYGYLRAVQSEVLEAWSPRRDERDIVIKTNTGGGKTIVGLLMLQCSLHEGRGPALYLAPDPHLASRATDEAKNLGLEVTDNPEASRFHAGDAICVTTMKTLLNGRSRFGLLGSATRQPIPVGTIVIDDAHAALAQAEEDARLTIPSTHPTYGQLLTLFDEDLRTQGLNTYLDIRDGEHSAVLRIPFWSWQDRADEVLAILRPSRHEADFEWSWPLIGDIVDICEAVVTSSEIEIKPPLPPIEKFPSFNEAPRRIYLSATLADDSVLVTHFDADETSVSNSIVPGSAADLGDRLVLAPQELNADITHSDIVNLASDVAATHNVVVLVPSKRAATAWDSVSERTVSTAAAITQAVKDLGSGQVGLVVVINRYDGIDLPDDACRLLIIDNLPFAFSGSDRREAVALRNSQAMVARQLQRLEQGMGRGVRSRDDRCAILLLGPRLTQLVARADVADRLSPATRAQLALSRRVAGRLQGANLAGIKEVVSQVVAGDAEFRRLSREALIGVTYGPAILSPTARPLRDAYNAAVAGRDEAAAQHSGEAVASVADVDPRLAGWLGETHASYLHRVDQAEAQTVLAASAQLNTAVLRPRAGVPYTQITAASAQAEQTLSTLRARYSSPTELVVGVDALLADLVWDNTRTDDAEAALADLGRHLGFVAQEPEREFDIGSDVLWAQGDHKYAVIEAKTGATASLIWKKDINQLAGSVNWCKSEYGADASVAAIMVHPSSIVERTGTPPAGARVVTKASLKSLKSHVRAFAIAVARDTNFGDGASIQQNLAQHDLTRDRLFEAYSVPARRQPKKS